MLRQAGTFSPYEQCQGAVRYGRQGVEKRDGGRVGGEGHCGEIALFKQVKLALPSGGGAVEMGEWEAKHVAHGDADDAAIKGVGTACAEKDGVDTHACCVAEECANVFVIADALEDRHGPGTFDSLFNRKGGCAIGGGHETTVHIKTRDGRQHLARDLEHGYARVAVRIEEGRQLRPETHDHSNGKARGEEAGNYERALRHHQAFAPWEVGAAVGVVEGPDVIKAGILRVCDKGRLHKPWSLVHAGLLHDAEQRIHREIHQEERGNQPQQPVHLLGLTRGGLHEHICDKTDTDTICD